MGALDEADEAFRATLNGAFDSPGAGLIVGPSRHAAGKIHGHHLDGGEAHVFHMTEAVGGGRERALGRKRADVEFVNYPLTGMEGTRTVRGEEGRLDRRLQSHRRSRRTTNANVPLVACCNVGVPVTKRRVGEGIIPLFKNWLFSLL